MLIARTLAAANPAQAEVVRSHLGDPDLDAEGVSRLRQIIEETGALVECEEMIKRYVDEALASLDERPDHRGGPPRPGRPRRARHQPPRLTPREPRPGGPDHVRRVADAALADPAGRTRTA